MAKGKFGKALMIVGGLALAGAGFAKLMKKNEEQKKDNENENEAIEGECEEVETESEN